MSLISRYLEANGVSTVVIGTARDIVEHCGVARFVFADFPLGSPCGEPENVAQQRTIFQMALDLLGQAKEPRTTMQLKWRGTTPSVFGWRWFVAAKWAVYKNAKTPYLTPETSSMIPCAKRVRSTS